MIYAEKGNRVKRINEADIQFYVEDGYRIINSDGTVIRETVPTDIATLKRAFVEKSNTIRELTAEVESLKAEVARLSSTSNSTVSSATAQPTAKRGRKKDSETEE